jgi:hypothetical protein
MRYVAMLLLSCGLAVPMAVAQDDHPLVRRYEGSTLQSQKSEAFGAYQLVTGRTTKGDFIGEALQGKVTRLVYQNPQGRATLEIFRNYQQALAGVDMTTIYTCALDECGPAYARSAWQRYNGLFAATDGDPRYLSGKLTTDAGTAYVALMVGRQRTQLDVVEIVGMQENLVVADATALDSEANRAKNRRVELVMR